MCMQADVYFVCIATKMQLIILIFTFASIFEKTQQTKMRDLSKWKRVRGASEIREVEKLFYDIWWHINHRSNQCNFHSLPNHTKFFFHFTGGLMCKILISLNIVISIVGVGTAWVLSRESWRVKKEEKDNDMKLQKACIRIKSLKN